MGESGKENTCNSYPAQVGRFDLNKFLFVSLWNPDIDTEHSCRQGHTFWLMLDKAHIALGPGSLVLCTSCSHQWLVTAAVICRLTLSSTLQPFHKQGAWWLGQTQQHSHISTGGRSPQLFWGLAEWLGQVVSLTLTTTLEEASWHENMSSEPRKLSLHSVSCSDPCELVYFSQLISRWCQDSILCLFQELPQRWARGTSDCSMLVASSTPGRLDSPRQTQCHAALCHLIRSSDFCYMFKILNKNIWKLPHITRTTVSNSRRNSQEWKRRLPSPGLAGCDLPAKLEAYTSAETHPSQSKHKDKAIHRHQDLDKKLRIKIFMHTAYTI